MAVLAASCSSDGGQQTALTAVETERAESTIDEQPGAAEPEVTSGESETSASSTTEPPLNETSAPQPELDPASANYVVSSEPTPGYERIESGDGVLSFVVPQGWSLRTDQRTSVHLDAGIIDLAIDVGGGASFLSAIEGGGGDQAGVWLAAVDALVPVDNETLDEALRSRGSARGDCQLAGFEDFEIDLFVGRALTLEQCGATQHGVSLVIGRLQADERILVFIEASLVELSDILDYAVLLEDITVSPAALR